jgi:hypothetical protein
MPRKESPSQRNEITGYSDERGGIMEITRNVIQDLLPLYIAGEVSADTTALVEKYLETDPELAKMAQQAAQTGLSEVPIPLSKETEMEAYKKATRLMVFRTLALAAILSAIFLCTLGLVSVIILMFMR